VLILLAIILAADLASDAVSVPAWLWVILVAFFLVNLAVALIDN
jgi:hypothetical protein